MTTKTYDEMIAVMQAARDGKQIEWRRHSGGDWEQTTPVWNWNVCDYRIKPEPKLRPWKPEDVPMPCILRPMGGNSHQAMWLVLTVSSSGVATADCHVKGETRLASFEALLLHNEHSTDGGKTWKPCGVEE